MFAFFKSTVLVLSLHVFFLPIPYVSIHICLYLVYLFLTFYSLIFYISVGGKNVCLLALEKEYVLVTGSANDNDKMEVIDKKGKTTVCPSKTFPEKVSSATGGVLEEHILICGGGFPATKGH